ncbi:MAG: GNAT family N-acetyltransferase [Phenylobacterium sp.]|uniref:GNAT family N-acetyltransferase n=1 Tax=Phenylobacterium sp. TaxID=1871053 RepID=UPI00271CB4A1|nr:GNAT family N-acetyltransferase [Phenylobacterium sp.]MDO8902159.1 GNAT family N-acetyltransferase [Phenylobacterium sp.]
MMNIRLARPEDLDLLPEIEVSAATLFRDQGLAITSDETDGAPLDFTPAAVWKPIAAAGLLWVVAEEKGPPGGFLAARIEDNRLHILEFDVHRRHQGQGLGRRLLAFAIAEARRRGLEGLSLTTFRDAPWNAPFYASAGFKVIERDAAPETLQAYLDREASRGLDPARRCAMIMSLKAQRSDGSA